MRVLFVCTGNICRSPLAHAVFEHQLRELGLTDFEVESAGTHAYHVGENADLRMRRTAEAHGIRFNHPARLVNAEDLANYDLILAMGSDHFRHLQRLARSDAERGKVVMFRRYDPRVANQTTIPDVPDPYYDGPEAFQEVYRIVERTSRNLIVALTQVGVRQS